MQRLRRHSVRVAIFGLLVLSFAGFIAQQSVVGADDQPAGDGAPVTRKKALRLDDVPPSLLAVPANGTPKDYLKIIHRINALQPDFQAGEEAKAEKFLATSRSAIIAAADKLLQNKPDEAQYVEAQKAKLNAYQDLLVVGVPNALPNALQFAEQLKADKRPVLSEIGHAAWLDFKMSTIPKSEPKVRREIVSALATELDKRPKSYIEFAQQMGRMLEMMGDGDTAALAYETFGNILAKNLDENIRALGESMRTGSVRRVKLLSGAPLKVSGTTIDGKPFDISQYKGKVVVVDFWATWCGPCVAELPNLKAVYEKYHNQGLEVVGISLDDDKGELTKFLKTNDLPWKILFNSDAQKKGFQTPSADYYGISAIPAIFLMNRDGKVVSLEARGEVLGEMVENLIKGGGSPAGSPPESSAPTAK